MLFYQFIYIRYIHIYYIYLYEQQIIFLSCICRCYIQLLAGLSKGTQRVSDPPPPPKYVNSYQARERKRERETDNKETVVVGDLDCFSLFFFFVYCVYFVNYTTSN